jgi:hypothetical protein
MTTRGQFHGKPTISLGGGRFPFTFGVAKAKLILEHIEEIEQFVAEHDAKQGPSRNERILESGYQAYAREEGHCV